MVTRLPMFLVMIGFTFKVHAKPGDVIEFKTQFKTGRTEVTEVSVSIIETSEFGRSPFHITGFQVANLRNPGMMMANWSESNVKHVHYYDNGEIGIKFRYGFVRINPTTGWSKLNLSAISIVPNDMAAIFPKVRVRINPLKRKVSKYSEMKKTGEIIPVNSGRCSEVNHIAP